MELDEIKRLRKELEIQMITLIQKFEIITKTSISTIDLVHSREIGSNMNTMTIAVKLEI